MDFQQFAANRVPQLGHVTGRLKLQLLEENLSRKRVAVRMKAARGEADDNISRPNRLAIEHSRFFHDADNRAAHVILARPIKARQLRQFAVNERAAIFGASLCEPFDDFGESARLQFAGADVIQEEQGFRAEDGNVVDAMIDEVLTNGVVAAENEGQFEFGADAVHARDEYGLFVFSNIQRE